MFQTLSRSEHAAQLDFQHLAVIFLRKLAYQSVLSGAEL